MRNSSWAAPRASSGTVTWACSTASSAHVKEAGTSSGAPEPVRPASWSASAASRASAAESTAASAVNALAAIRPTASWISGSSRNGRPRPVLKVRTRTATASAASRRAARAIPARTASRMSWNHAAS